VSRLIVCDRGALVASILLHQVQMFTYLLTWRLPKSLWIAAVST